MMNYLWRLIDVECKQSKRNLYTSWVEKIPMVTEEMLDKLDMTGEWLPSWYSIVGRGPFFQQLEFNDDKGTWEHQERQIWTLNLIRSIRVVD